MKLVGYLRDSTDRQAEEGLGLEVQEQSIRQWAKATGHRLVAIYKDAGVSGSNGLDVERVGDETILSGTRPDQPACTASWTSCETGLDRDQEIDHDLDPPAVRKPTGEEPLRLK